MLRVCPSPLPTFSPSPPTEPLAAKPRHLASLRQGVAMGVIRLILFESTPICCPVLASPPVKTARTKCARCRTGVLVTARHTPDAWRLIAAVAINQTVFGRALNLLTIQNRVTENAVVAPWRQRSGARGWLGSKPCCWRFCAPDSASDSACQHAASGRHAAGDTRRLWLVPDPCAHGSSADLCYFLCLYGTPYRWHGSRSGRRVCAQTGQST